MTLPLSSSVAAKLLWLESVGSTNDALVDLASGPDARSWPHLAVVATDNHVSGKGRLDRVWTAPAGRCLAVSILLRPDAGLGAGALGWIPLLAGAAMTTALRSVVAAELGEAAAEAVSLKWPNDVLVDGRKICGILGAILPAEQGAPSGSADTGQRGAIGLVIGAGVNLSLTEDELPVPTATSLAIVGVSAPSVDLVLSSYLTEFTRLYREFSEHHGDAVASGLHTRVSELCGTLSRSVRVELPGGAVRTGTAVEIAPDGRLGIDPGSVARSGENINPETELGRFYVSAGDITHLRL